MDEIVKKQERKLTSHEAHKLFKNHLILALSESGAYVWSNETGVIQSKAGHFISYGKKGSADILGVWHGMFLAVEAKTGSGRQSEQQIIFQQQVAKQGGIYHVAKWNGQEPIKIAAMREVRAVADRIKGIV